MALVLLTANHHDLDLADVERLSTGASAVADLVVAADGARGAVVLATCNRLEVYVDAGSTAEAAEVVRAAVARASGTAVDEVTARMRVLAEDEATEHLFAVAAGLDSLVVGEREIIGQVRRSLETARAAGTVSPLLERTFQHAARTSREVAVTTDLARAGRSVVSVALDLADAHALACRRVDEPWPDDAAAGVVPQAGLTGKRALLVGTGSYAGASLAALRGRGATEVEVWSASGRAEGFAERHAIAPVPVGGLAAALVRADLVVACRGTGAPVLEPALVRQALARRSQDVGPLVVVDLALQRDVAPEVADLPGVVVVDLATVRRHTPAATAAEVDRAREIVADGVRRLGADLASRAMNEAVVALRERVDAAVAAEVERLPAGHVPAEQAERALRRLAARLAHTPTVRARSAGRDGRADEHLRALEQVLGLAPAVTAEDDAAAPIPATVPAEPQGRDR